jgi:hypothetical protein
METFCCTVKKLAMINYQRERDATDPIEIAFPMAIQEVGSI